VAGIGSRFMAAFVDFLAYFVIAIGVSILYGQINRRVADPALSSALEAAYIAFTFLLYWAYYIVFELVWGGQSPGKRLVGLRVIRIDGAPAAPGQIVICNIMRLVDLFPGFYVTGLVTMFLNSQSRRLGDFAAGTLVVREGRKVSLSQLSHALAPTLHLSEHAAAEATALPIHRLDPERRNLVREFIARRADMSTRQRATVAMQIAGSVAQRLDMPQPASPAAAEYLIELAAAASEQQASA
jgi:uncharacterized RDD family membrane protein YckC